MDQNINEREDGFTLIEIVVVVAILGILTAIGLFSYRGLTGLAEQRAVDSGVNGLANQSMLYAPTPAGPVPAMPSRPRLRNRLFRVRLTLPCWREFRVQWSS